MSRILPLFLICALAGCNASDPVNADPDPQTGPSGDWTISPAFFRLNLITDAANGITQDLQGTIEGSMRLTVTDGEVTGSGQCSWTTRRHTARTGQTINESRTESFSVSGMVTGADARLVLTGCAWNQLGYRGTWTEGRYDLSLPAGTQGPVFAPDEWSEGRLTHGDGHTLVLVRP